MVSAINYQAIVQELKARFAEIEDQKPEVQLVGAQMCLRMIHFLDIDPTLTLEEVILQLEEKWRSEGLIKSNGTRP